jgi:hypothetical protein
MNTVRYRQRRLTMFGLLKKSLAVGVVMVGVLAFASGASAYLFQASDGNLAASVDFVTSGGDLVVTLTNTSSNDVLIPSEVLTAVFFDVIGVGSLTPVSALLNGSTVFFGPNGGGNVGGEWAYGSGLAGAPELATEGISSSGFGLFGGPNFVGSNLQDPVAVDGLNYGITSAGDNTGTGNAQVTGNVALIRNSVVFTLSGLPNSFVPSSSSITHIVFQYGTALTEPHFPPSEKLPEPATVLLLGAGLAGLGILRWRKKA